MSEQSKTMTEKQIDESKSTEKLIIPKVFIELIITNGTSKMFIIKAYLLFSPHSVT
jgi:hypothetical protein